MGEYDRTGNGQNGEADWDLRSILCDMAKNWWIILLIACSGAHIFSVSTLYQQIIEYSRRAAISIIKNRILLLKPMFAYHVYSCEQSEYYP